MTLIGKNYRDLSLGGQPQDIDLMLVSWQRKLENRINEEKRIAALKPTFEPPATELKIGMHYEEIELNNSGVKSKVNTRMRDGLPSVVVTSDGICEVSAEGLVTKIHQTNDPTERNDIITKITNVSGNSKDSPRIPDGQFYMYAHVLERVKDRYPHTKNWGIRAMTKYTIKQFCASKVQFITTNQERYVIKGNMTFVVNIKGVIVTVIRTTRDFLLYAECWKATGEKIPSWLVSKKAMVIREDIIIKFSPEKAEKRI